VTNKAFDLGDVFAGTTQQMLAEFWRIRAATGHPVSKGDDLEEAWRKTLAGFLPGRYAVNKAQVVDCEGNVSDQIDLVVHDRHFSPTFLVSAGQVWVPAEAVLAVFEVKPELNKEKVEYAGQKVASVRRLQRTSANIRQLAQDAGPAPVGRILGGLLTAASDWTPDFGASFEDALAGLGEAGRLDIGCTLDAGMWEVRDPDAPKAVTHAGKDVGLATFALRLVARLNSFGTVPALDYDRYTADLVDGPAGDVVSG
jgi:hypothetical protein